MGLDMYLKRKLPIFNWGIAGEKPIKVKVTRGGKSLPFINNDKIDEIIEDVAYWRKFNALHKWFVENVQNGIDECQTAPVSVDQLKTLLSLLKELQKNPDMAETLLPTTDGFFFGGTEYDEFYFEEVNRTVEILEDLIRDDEKYKVYFEYFYRSSW